MYFKRTSILFISLMLVMSFGLSVVYANGDEAAYREDVNISFKDVGADHWAYKEITWMASEKIINGHPDKTFKPENPVTRAEFAKMMVLALKLMLIKPEISSFRDVSKKDWEYPYVETAKYYLTGFRINSADYFKPSNAAVREDMAVALVKALELSGETVSDEDLQVFSDSSTISTNLKKYVSIAVKKNIMQGYPADNNSKLFKPQGVLTRAEAAVLLYRTVCKEEKITYDEEKVTYDTADQTTQDGTVSNDAPVVTGDVDGNKVVLRWQAISDIKLQGYKVVISKYNSAPKYPDDGYMFWITDKSRTYAVISSSETYNGGDFGKYLIPGEKYYFSVTAVYSDRKVPGNAVQITFPGR